MFFAYNLPAVVTSTVPVGIIIFWETISSASSFMHLPPFVKTERATPPANYKKLLAGQTIESDSSKVMSPWITATLYSVPVMLVYRKILLILPGLESDYTTTY